MSGAFPLWMQEEERSFPEWEQVEECCGPEYWLLKPIADAVKALCDE